MAKGRRYKYRYYKKKGIWSSNIKNVNDTILQLSGPGEFYGNFTLCSNPPQSDENVSQKFTVKNTEFCFQIETSSLLNATTIESLTYYIMFVPQGMTINNNLVKNHPEYIMAMRFIGSPEAEFDQESNAQLAAFRNTIRIKSRLARRLNTGDSIVFLITGYHSTGGSVELKVNGIVRWWTKAN